jgi:hypothetical protein
LEVAVRSGRELPGVVDGEFDGGQRVAEGPRRTQLALLVGGHVETETG